MRNVLFQQYDAIRTFTGKCTDQGSRKMVNRKVVSIEQSENVESSPENPEDKEIWWKATAAFELAKVEYTNINSVSRPANRNT